MVFLTSTAVLNNQLVKSQEKRLPAKEREKARKFIFFCLFHALSRANYFCQAKIIVIIFYHSEKKHLPKPPAFGLK